VSMIDKLAWNVKGETFIDGSQLRDWQKIYQSPNWHWQYDTHELTYAIYQHDGQYWKLYLGRYVLPGTTEYTYDYGGIACRVLLVLYRIKSRSPHSATLKLQSDQEWIRINEYNPDIHKVLQAGQINSKYKEPYRIRNDGS